MSVYIITDRAAGHCKVGYSQTPLKRLSMLRTSSPAALALEAVVPGDLENERQLHRALRRHHVAREWFEIGEDVERLIAAFRPAERKGPGAPRKLLGPVSRYSETLAAYLGDPENTQVALASAIGKTQAAVARYANGKRFPDADTAREIDRATGGAVPFGIWRNEAAARLGLSPTDREAA